MTGVTEHQIGAVLVVDDDAATREGLKALLAGAGFAVFTAANGEEALRILPILRRCVVVLDLAMPKMTGEDFVIAALDFPNAMWRFPTVVLTGSDRIEHAHRLPLVMDVLRKPVDGQMLLRAVQDVAVIRVSGRDAG